MRGVLTFVATMTVVIAGQPRADAVPRLQAVRVTKAPAIDGRLDEQIWREARVVSGFTQRSPREGAPPDQRTEMRVLYDESALYVALRMWDSQPAAIRRGLGRRDNPPDSDSVTLAIDSLMSHERGYFFRINASGVLSDGIVYQQTQVDSSWDAVWNGASTVDPRGWTAELKIPLASIAFQQRPEQAWGLYVERYVVRNKEVSSWPAMPKSSNTFVSRFGRLEGLEGLRRGSAVRVQPYAAGEVQISRRPGSLRPGDAFRPNGGLDLRYGLSGDLIIHASINPDFGQVEDDPAVVNLGPDEVFFGERRPFFVAGAELFRTPLMLLHTRRIGARPDTPEPETDGEIVEQDPEARIIGAAKLVGERGRFSYGLLSAGVLPSHAVERRPDGTLVERLAAPGSHYGAGRLRLRLGEGASIGLLASGLTRVDAADAYAGGIDWDLRSSSGWQTTGQIAGSTALEGAGYGLKLIAGQQGAPRWRYWLEGESFSEGFEINHLGYQWRNEMVRMRAYLQRRLPAPWRLLREWNATLWGGYGFNHTDPELGFDRRVELSSYARLINQWGLWTGLGYRFPTLDDRETRGGPAYPRPAQLYGWLGGESDTSRRLVLEGTVGVGFEEAAPTLNANAALRASLLNRLTLTLAGTYRMQRGQPRWVETLDDAADPRHIFGDLDRDELELKLSGVLALHRLVTLQLFGQLLHSTGTYDRYRELRAGSLVATDRDAAADFALTRLIVNAILRWDLSGGAAAYLVYKMDGALEHSGVEAGHGFDIGEGLSVMGSQRQTHLLLFKVSYGFEV